MPYVEIQCYEGRTDEMKKVAAEKIAQTLSEVFGCPETAVTVAIKDVKPSEWQEKVVKPCIIPNKNYLYKKSGDID